MRTSTDNLLAQKRQEDSPELFFVQEKTASAQPPVSVSGYSSTEIEKMANLLVTGEIGDESTSFNERIAQAMILQSVIQDLVKVAEEEASECEDSDKGKESEPKKEDKEEEKVAAFVKSARENGHSEQEISEYLEKEAKLKLSPEVKKRLGLAALGVGATAAGHEVGKKKGQKETAEKAVKAMPIIHRMGMIRGYKMGLERAARKDG